MQFAETAFGNEDSLHPLIDAIYGNKAAVFVFYLAGTFVQTGQSQRITGDLLLGNGEMRGWLYMPIRCISKSNKGIVSIWKIEAIQKYVFVSFGRIAVDTSQQKVVPATHKSLIGRQSFGLNMLNGQIAQHGAFAIATVHPQPATEFRIGIAIVVEIRCLWTVSAVNRAHLLALFSQFIDTLQFENSLKCRVIRKRCDLFS